jgi:hypothetical protein
MHIKPRDLMAPDTEPTDEELALVMREARDLAVQRRAIADAWVAARRSAAGDGATRGLLARGTEPGVRNGVFRSGQTGVRAAGTDLGYFVRLFFVGTDRPGINAARVARRVLQGGHEVPIRKIVDRWGHSIANAASVAAEVDRFYIYDNSVDDRDAQLVLRPADGRVVRAYGDAPAWTSPILERLAPCES